MRFFSISQENRLMFFSDPETAKPDDAPKAAPNEGARLQPVQQRFQAEKEQEDRLKEGGGLKDIEQKMEVSLTAQQSREKIQERVKALNERLTRLLESIPNGMSNSYVFRNIYTRLSYGEENGRTFLAWDVPEEHKEIMENPMMRKMIRSARFRNDPSSTTNRASWNG